jgi:membrane-associated phospholipid phosphatase
VADPARPGAALSGPVDLALTVVGASGYAFTAVRGKNHPGRVERRAFTVLNSSGEPSRLRWLAQQVDTPWTLPVLVLAALRSGRNRLAAASLVTLGLGKAVEGLTKLAEDRRRPAEVMPGPQLRDDPPREGASFPSGHTATATSAAVLLAPELMWPVSLVTGAVVFVTSYRRVGQGAHFPLDVVGGAFLGGATAGAARLVAGHD